MRTAYKLTYFTQCHGKDFFLPCAWFLEVTTKNGELARYVWLKDKPTKTKLRKLVNKLIRSLRDL